MWELTFCILRWWNTSTKKGETVSRLKPVMKSANMVGIIKFINDILPKNINYRNHLKHYRNTIKNVRDNFNALFLYTDFSENFSLLVKFEPLSLHWHKEQVTIHSGIVKLHGEKSYHPYMSNDHKHDQKFAKLVRKEMLDTVDTIPKICVIESDNCAAQYKPAQHFDDIQAICNKIEVPIIHIFSVARHGKGGCMEIYRWGCFGCW